MAENVRVVVRCRPMNQREISLKCKDITKISKCALSVTNTAEANAPEKEFTFDNVYGPASTTESLYNDVCYALVDNVLEGYNGTIFAYGQTGCGKTHTMQGPDLLNMEDIPSSQRGIISRAFDHMFEAISVASGVRYLAFVSYLEIYNENIRDLLNDKEGVNSNHALKELPGVGVTVPTLSTHTVLSAKECYELLNAGNKNRRIGATLMNATSSRSHSIFTIDLEQITEDDDNESRDDTESKGAIRRGKLNLVDLAGSERQNKTGAMGDRLKEASKINLSLSALGNVISALVDGKTKHIPYRDSKLTRLLQDSLGGNTKTLMISCISPADNNYDETLSTLRYASRAKNIANKPKINEDPKDAKLREYQEEILKLKQMLNSSNQTMPEKMIIPSTDSDNEQNGISRDAWLEAERSKLRQEMNLEIQSIKEAHNEQQRAKDEQMREVTELRKNYEEQLRRLNAFERAPPLAEYEEQAGGKENNKELLQLEARKRIEVIKRALIGGERAHDVQLKERRQKKKLDAQRRLSALAQALSRIDQSEDRDILQGHYTDIQQELQMKNDYLKKYRQKVKALEREVSDLQAEFQMDRADYLDTIRRLECNMKFYQQLIDKALPILRKDGKYWDPENILQNSTWNDDLKVWKLPQSTLNYFKLPLTTGTKNTTVESQNPKNCENPNPDNNATENNNNSNDIFVEEIESSTPVEDILNNYFRSDRQKSKEIMQQRKSFNNWKDFVNRRQSFKLTTPTIKNLRNVELTEESKITPESFFLRKDRNGIIRQNRALSSWERPNALSSDALLMNKTWTGINDILNKAKDSKQQFLQPLQTLTIPNDE